MLVFAQLLLDCLISVVAALSLFNAYVDDLSVNFNKLQISCLYAGTIIFVFSPSVAGLRKLTDCCAKYGNIFVITYNANKSFCMVIDNKPEDKNNIHPVVINNHTLPHTEKCKYLGHIINNNLTDDDDIARQKRCIYAQANVLARKFNLCNSTIKTTLFNSYCGSLYTSSLWCNLKNSLKGITVAYNNSFIILHNLSPHCSVSHVLIM